MISKYNLYIKGYKIFKFYIINKIKNKKIIILKKKLKLIIIYYNN